MLENNLINVIWTDNKIVFIFLLANKLLQSSICKIIYGWAKLPKLLRKCWWKERTASKENRNWDQRDSGIISDTFYMLYKCIKYKHYFCMFQQYYTCFGISITSFFIFYWLIVSWVFWVLFFADDYWLTICMVFLWKRTELQYNLQKCCWYDTPLNLLKLKTTHFFVVWIWAIYFIWTFLVPLSQQRGSLHFFTIWSGSCNTIPFYFSI